METVKNIASAVIAIGGLGAFIDFLIGRARQAKAKDFLLRWWVRFDDVRWKNFGREEGLFAGRLIEQWFGKKIWSVRRLVVTVFLFCFLLVANHLKLEILSQKPLPSIIIGDHQITFGNDICTYCPNKLILGTAILLYFAAFSFCVSFTRFVTFRIASLCGIGRTKNLIMFLSMFIVNFMIIVFWFPVAELYRQTMIIFIPLWISQIFSNPNRYLFIQQLYTIGYLFIQLLYEECKLLPHKIISQILFEFTLAKSVPPTRIPIGFIKRYLSLNSIEFAFTLLVIFPNILRTFLSITFVGSFLLRPLIMRPVNLVWRRIIESEKPVFTVIFGGAAAFVTAIIEAAKHL
jgi:hypothetical protein